MNKPIGCTHPECGKCKLPDCEWDGYELDDLVKTKLVDEKIERNRAKARRYYERHKDKVKAYNNRYRVEHKDKCKELVDKWRNENREYVNAQARDYRRRKRMVFKNEQNKSC